MWDSWNPQVVGVGSVVGSDMLVMLGKVVVFGKVVGADRVVESDMLVVFGKVVVFGMVMVLGKVVVFGMVVAFGKVVGLRRVAAEFGSKVVSLVEGKGIGAFDGCMEELLLHNNNRPNVLERSRLVVVELVGFLVEGY